MSAGIFNVVVGLLLLGAGASGQFTLLFTNSSIALVAIGAGIAGLGVFQILRARRNG